MLEDFGCTQEELSSRIKRSRPQISNTIRLLRLPPTVQRRVAAGVLSAGHARALLAIEDAAEQERLAQRVVAEGLSVRESRSWSRSAMPAARPRRRGDKPARVAVPEADDAAQRLSDHLDTRVRVEMGRSKGRIVIEFATADDLDRIVEPDRRRAKVDSSSRSNRLSAGDDRHLGLGQSAGTHPVARAGGLAASLRRTSLVADRSATNDRKGTVPASAIRSAAASSTAPGGRGRSR